MKNISIAANKITIMLPGTHRIPIKIYQEPRFCFFIQQCNAVFGRNLHHLSTLPIQYLNSFQKLQYTRNCRTPEIAVHFSGFLMYFLVSKRLYCTELYRVAEHNKGINALTQILILKSLYFGNLIVKIFYNTKELGF